MQELSSHKLAREARCGAPQRISCRFCLAMLSPPLYLVLPADCPDFCHQRYHRFTVMFESPSEESLIFNVDSSEDPEAHFTSSDLK